MGELGYAIVSPGTRTNDRTSGRCARIEENEIHDGFFQRRHSSSCELRLVCESSEDLAAAVLAGYV